MTRHYAPVVLFHLLLGGCSFSPADETAAVGAILDSLLVEHAEHFRTGNIDGLVDAYTADAEVRPAGVTPIRGHAAIRASLPQWINAAPIQSLAYTNAGLAVRGDTAFQIVSYDIVVRPPGAGDVRDGGSCALWWERNDVGEWRVSRSLCNSSTPPSQQLSRPSETSSGN